MNNRIIRFIISLMAVLFMLNCNLVTVYANTDDYADYYDWDSVDANIYQTDDGRYYYYYNPDTGYEAVVEDDADRLTDDEEYYLLYYMYALTDYGSAYYKSIDYNPYSSAAEYARHYLNDLKDCYGGGSGTVFLDDTVNRRLEIFSNGTMLRYITSGKAVSITDNVYRYASAGRYYECAAEVYYEMYVLLNNGKIAEPMKNISNIFLSIIISLTLCFVIAIWTSRTKKASVNAVMKQVYRHLNFTDTRKVFTGQTKVYDPPSSDSSSGGSSGGGGGGGGHSY